MPKHSNPLCHMQIDTTYSVTFDHEWPVEAVRGALSAARSVVLVAHTNADGDAVGSLTGFARILSLSTHAKITPMLPDGVPDDLTWMPHADGVLSGQSDHEACLAAIADADLVVTLDLNNLDRTGILADALRSASAPRLLVDHHESPDTALYSYIVSEPAISSTCELVYWLTLQLFGPNAIDHDAATSLYAGICTDTGTFAYSNNRKSIYLATANLLDYGVDPMEVNRQIKNVFTQPRLRFFGHAIADLLTVYEKQQVAVMVITADEMKRYGVQSHELTGLINEVMKLRAIDCGILIREEDGKVRLSLRSKSIYDVNQLASNLFDGGGHRRAAGATSKLSLKATVEKVKKELGLFLILFFSVCLMSACNNVPVIDVTPQKGDTLKENMINANRIIAESEETQIDAYITRRGWHMQRLSGGARVMETHRGNGSPINYEDTVVVTYNIQAINGIPIYDQRRDTVVAGHLKPTRGFDAALRTLHRGSTAYFVLPSEQAYGVVGDGDKISTRMVLVFYVEVDG